MVSSTSSIADTTSSVLNAEALDTIKEKFNAANPWELVPVTMVKLVTNKHRAVAIITRARTSTTLDQWLRTGWFLVYYIHKGPCREYNKVYDICAIEYTYWCVCYRNTYVMEYTYVHCEMHYLCTCWTFITMHLTLFTAHVCLQRLFAVCA